MLCPNCGFQLQRNTSVCPRCHLSLQREAQQETPDERPVKSQATQAESAAHANVAQSSSPPVATVSSWVNRATIQRHLVRFTIAAIILIAVTVASNVLRSNTIYSSSLRSSSNLWDVGTLSNGAACLFHADGYHLRGSADCGAQLSPQSDFLLSTDVKDLTDGEENTCVGSSHTFGLILRANLDRSGSQLSMNGYYFVINASQGWAFTKISGNREWMLASGTNEALRPGLNVTNTLAVSAIGSRFDLFSNGTQIGQVEDTTFTSGSLRLINTCPAGSDVVFTNINMTHNGSHNYLATVLDSPAIVRIISLVRNGKLICHGCDSHGNDIVSPAHGTFPTFPTAASGAFVSPDGYVLTADHAVDPASDIFQQASQDIASRYNQRTADYLYQHQDRVQINGQKDSLVLLSTTYIGAVQQKNQLVGFPVTRIVASSPWDKQDIAIVQVDVRNVPNLSVATDSVVSIGESVTAIAFPGVTDNASSGIDTSKSTPFTCLYQLPCSMNEVSNLLTPTQSQGSIIAKKDDPRTGLVYVTSPIGNHGSSGGPVIDQQGRIVGIVETETDSTGKQTVSASGETISHYLKQAGITNSGQGAFQIAWTKAMTEYESTTPCHFTNAAQDLEILHERYPYFGAVLPILSDAQSKTTPTECFPSVSSSATLMGGTVLVVLTILMAILVRRRQSSRSVLVAAGMESASTTYPISATGSRGAVLTSPEELDLPSPPANIAARIRSWLVEDVLEWGKYMIIPILALTLLWLGALGAQFASVWCFASAVNLFQQGPQSITCAPLTFWLQGQGLHEYLSCSPGGGPFTSPVYWGIIVALAMAGLFMLSKGWELLLNQAGRYPFSPILRRLLFGVALLTAIISMAHLGGIAAVWSTWRWMVGGVALAGLAGGINYVLTYFRWW